MSVADFWNNPRIFKILMKAKKTVLGHIFPHISGSIGPMFTKTRMFTHEWTRTNCVNFTKISFKKWSTLCPTFLYINMYFNISDL